MKTRRLAFVLVVLGAHGALIAQPGTPLIGPAFSNGPISITIVWTPASPRGERGFLIYEETEGLVEHAHGGAGSVEVTNLEPETAYRFRVRAYWETGQGFQYSSYSAWSESVMTGVSTLGIPEQIAPGHGSIVRPDSLRFSWHAVPQGFGYRLQALPMETRAVVLDWQATDTTQDVSGFLSPNARYRWRVRAVDSSGIPSRWSDEWEITLARIGVSENVPAPAILFQNYPNPFNPKSVIQFFLPRLMRAELVVCSVTGEQIAILVRGTVPAGTHEAYFDGGPFPSGVYFYTLRSGSFSLTRKMLLMR